MLDLKDIDYKPNMIEMSTYIDNPLFIQFNQFMDDEYKVLRKIEYSKDVWLKGWNIKLRKAGKGLCVIYPKKTIFYSIDCYWP